MKIDALLQEIRSAYETILSHNLVGIYLHGSLAFGCYHPVKSDIDFLVVTKNEPDLSEKIALVETLLRLDESAPEKGFEMSVVREADCRSFRHPMPFSLHFSNFHKARCAADPAAYCEGMHGEDPDLAAHCTVVRAVGIPLCGKPVKEVFGEVPREAYLDSLWGDIAEAEEDILENPVYVILNLCRVAAYLQDSVVLSKRDGGLWGLAHLPERRHDLIRQALTAYETGTEYQLLGMEQEFAGELLKEIQRKR